MVESSMVVRKRLQNALPVSRVILSIILAFALSFSLLVSALPSKAFADPAPLPPINEIFLDAAIAENVAKQLNVEVDAVVTQDDLDSIDTLNLTDYKTTSDLTGVEKLRNLTELDLYGTAVSYSLQEIASYAPNLERLDITGLKVTGTVRDLGFFENLSGLAMSSASLITGQIDELNDYMPKATILNLSSTILTGDVESLGRHINADNFVTLILEHSTGFSGDIAAFSGMTNLEVLAVGNTNLHGDITSLAALTNLKALGLDELSISGDISSWSDLTQLTRIQAAVTNVEGDIAVFANMPDLEILSLGGTKVSGEIQSLSNLSNLNALVLGTEDSPGAVTGELDKLTGITNLVTLDLTGQSVGGDVAGLSTLCTNNKMEAILDGNPITGDISSIMNSSFSVLSLAGTKVSGSIDGFKDYTYAGIINSLHLNDTDIAGDISAFSRMDHLQYLNIGNTMISGNIGDMVGEEVALVSFRAGNTRLSGSIDDIRDLFGLNWLDLSNTKVTGDLTKLAETFINLQELNLSGTGVSGNASALSSLEYLTQLDISNLKINLDKLYFSEDPIKVDIPVLKTEGDEVVALEPLNPVGGTFVKEGNTLTWDVPAEKKGSFSYDFETIISYDNGRSDASYSGKVAQEFDTVREVVEIAGANRVETAAENARKAYPNGSDTVIVSTSAHFPDALAAAPLAGALDAPIILTDDGDHLSEAAESVIDELGATKAIMLGSRKSLSSGIFEDLYNLTGNPVIRLGGENRIETQVAIFDYGKTLDLWKGDVIVSTAAAYADALSISAYAASTTSPVFLVDPATGFSDSQKKAIEDYSVGKKNAIITGGYSSVAKSVEDYFASINVESMRLAGGVDNDFSDSRFGTSAAIAQFCIGEGMTSDKVAFSTGSNFPDALVAGPTQAKEASFVVLTDPSVDGAGLDGARAIADHSVENCYELRFLGTTKSVSQEHRDEVQAIVWGEN